MIKNILDRILLRPQVITLENGHEVTRPRSKAPYLLLLLVIGVYISVRTTGFDIAMFVRRFNQLPVILGRIFQPNFGFFSTVWPRLVETIKMSIVGTVLGCILALPLSIVSSSNIMRHRVVLWIVRVLISITRSLPAVVYAYLFSFVFGMTTFAGSLAIAVFTVGIVAKMMYENIETIDLGAFEAMRSFGGTTLQSFWTACMPQILPQYLDNCLYSFELNIRQSAILGYCGVGGLGVLIRARISVRAYEDAGMIFLLIFVVVFAIDLINDRIRSKIIRGH
ncbi:MAG: phosphonate ABC transporter, permease protein PhnE [Lachnospiraceae bacterium]|nr:phosphonate ABC transporter, permease protein PhnE [Lachnospiraceae bacterium]MBQ9616602.1 phosphonate ABC transporter, permease protein PhnE [Selenomonadaceae bacterium]